MISLSKTKLYQESAVPYLQGLLAKDSLKRNRVWKDYFKMSWKPKNQKDWTQKAKIFLLWWTISLVILMLDVRNEINTSSSIFWHVMLFRFYFKASSGIMMTVDDVDVMCYYINEKWCNNHNDNDNVICMLFHILLSYSIFKYMNFPRLNYGI